MIIGNVSSTKVKEKTICDDQTVFFAVFTRHNSLIMSAIAKIDQQNIFFKNMQLLTKFILSEFGLLASAFFQMIIPCHRSSERQITAKKTV